MAIYHLHVRNISRKDGRSAVAAAAYRAGDTLPNSAEEKESAFGGRRDVLHAEIRLPVGAPAWMRNRGRLWNAVEAAEKRKDARLAKEIEFALPRELSRAEWLHIARAMADAYASQGHVVDLAIHDDGTAHNPHVHILLTTRTVTADGFGGKMREADGVKFVTEARALWAQLANGALGKSGAGVSIDARSYKARGEGREPGQHLGPDPVVRKERRAGMNDDTLSDARAEMAKAAALEALYPERSDVDLPVPDPDGNPIPRAEQEQAEQMMLAEVEAPADQYPQPPRPDGLSDQSPDVAAVRSAGDDKTLRNWWQAKVEQPERHSGEKRTVAETRERAWWSTGTAADQRYDTEERPAPCDRTR